MTTAILRCIGLIEAFRELEYFPRSVAVAVIYVDVTIFRIVHGLLNFAVGAHIQLRTSGPLLTLNIRARTHTLKACVGDPKMYNDVGKDLRWLSGPTQVRKRCTGRNKKER